MKSKILLLMRDDKYLKALGDFIRQKVKDAEVFSVSTLKDVVPMELDDFNIAVVSTILDEGIWLKSLPIIKKIPNIVVLAFSDGPQVTADMAKKYGARFFFTVPFNSIELLKAFETMQSESVADEVRPAMEVSLMALMKKTYSQLNTVNYYEMFGIQKNADIDEIKKRYVEIAKKFHPDKFRNNDEDVRKMAYEITKRTNEAYSVLSHPNRKQIYDKMLIENPANMRFDFHIKVNYDENPVDTILNPQVRRFIVLAQQAINEKAYKQAMTQLKMANSLEPNNKYIQRLISEVEIAMKAG